jgi:hypothetical protein
MLCNVLQLRSWFGARVNGSVIIKRHAEPNTYIISVGACMLIRAGGVDGAMCVCVVMGFGGAARAPKPAGSRGQR